MIALLFAAQVVALGATNYAVDAPMAAPTTEPGLADEFAGSVVDLSEWRFDASRNAAGWYHGERQYYAENRLQNARIENGALVIEARVERLSRARYRDWGGQA